MNYVIQGQTLTGIADAIRAQLGTEQQYTPESMAAAIGSIQGFGDIDSILTRNLSGNYVNDRITELGNNALASMQKLIELSLPNVTSLGNGAVQNCTSLAELFVPKCTILYNQALYGCYGLKRLNLPEVNEIRAMVFQSCSGLSVLVLSKNQLCSLGNVSTFTGTPIASGRGYIYVPDDLVEQYKVATNWATYASQIKGMSEIPAEVQQWLDQQGGAAT